MELLLPPSVKQKQPAPHLSSRYVHVDSEAVIAAMMQEGFSVAKINSANPRKRDVLYSRHTIDFRHPDMPAIGDAVPRIVFSNSHDGTSRASAVAGVFRFVCSNGLVVGNTYANEKVRHAGETAKELVARMQAIAKNTSPIFAQIERWSKIDMSESQRLDFARMAAMLRWGDPYRYAPESLLAVRREEDDKGDLWTVFNRVQEATTQGGVVGFTRTGQTTTARPLTEISSNLKFNVALWNLAEEFADLT